MASPELFKYTFAGVLVAGGALLGSYAGCELQGNLVARPHESGAVYYSPEADPVNTAALAMELTIGFGLAAAGTRSFVATACKEEQRLRRHKRAEAVVRAAADIVRSVESPLLATELVQPFNPALAPPALIYKVDPR